jgi:hypothetical protein
MKYLIPILFFLSCKNFPKNNIVAQSTNTSIATERLDTLKNIFYSVASKPEIFETAFFENAKANMDSLPINFYSVEIGKLNIESGKIIACDPIVIRDAKPFTQTFPTGKYSVQLAIAKIKDDERAAFSRILFSDTPVTKWEFALQNGQKQVPIDSETFYGYGVDAGIGLFIDEQARESFMQLYEKNANAWDKVFTKEMSKHYRNTWQYLVYDFDGHNLASFSTGYGDGTYATYVGYDAKGNICKLLTDFGLIDWWKNK